MQTIRFYRTYSFGGEEGRDIISRDFETEELARQDALQDTWNDGFRLYSVDMIMDGTVKFMETYISRIPCHREILHQEFLKSMEQEKDKESESSISR